MRFHVVQSKAWSDLAGGLAGTILSESSPINSTASSAGRPEEVHLKVQVAHQPPHPPDLLQVEVVEDQDDVATS